MLRSNAVSEASPRLRTGRRTTRPDPEQVVSILDAARHDGTRTALGLRLAAVSGARAAEVVALRWDDLNGDRLGIGRQRHSEGGKALVRDQTKSGGARVVVLDRGTLEASVVRPTARSSRPMPWSRSGSLVRCASGNHDLARKRHGGAQSFHHWVRPCNEFVLHETTCS